MGTGADFAEYNINIERLASQGKYISSSYAWVTGMSSPEVHAIVSDGKKIIMLITHHAVTC